MEITPFGIPGVMLITPHRIVDERGFFAEAFRVDLFGQHICGNWPFVQDNESYSANVGTVRGLHFQREPHAQGKLVRCTAGALFDVAVDIRHGSPTYGQWVGEILTPKNGKQIWIPSGFAHGFCTIEADTVICYKVTNYYNAECDEGLAWDDPDVGVEWPDIADPQMLSGKDSAQPCLADLHAYFSWSP